jgi:integrase
LRRTPKAEKHKFLSRDAVGALLEGPRKAGRSRDYYLLSLAYYLALRGGEVNRLRPEHFNAADGEVYVPTEKRKVRKGMITCPHSGMPLIRIPILFGDKVIEAALNWAREAKSEWLFPSRTVPGKPITTRQVRLTFKMWAKAAGLDPQVSAHSLRHSAGTHVNEIAGSRIRTAGGDPHVLVRDFMRHSDISITSIYLHSLSGSVDAARAAMRGARS